MFSTVGSWRSHNIRPSLRLSINSSPYELTEETSSDSESPPSSTRASIATSAATASTIDSIETPDSTVLNDWTVFSVLCLHEFESKDPDHLPFHKNDILDIVKQESSGWWAAMRAGGRKVGWIPRAFVEPLSEHMAERLRHVREELRVFEYEAERLYNSAPITRHDHLLSESPVSPLPNQDVWVPMNERTASTQLATPTDATNNRGFSSNPSLPQRGDNYINIQNIQHSNNDNRMPRPPPSPMTPMPQPPVPIRSAPVYNKPTPPTPVGQSFEDIEEVPRYPLQAVPDSPLQGRDTRRRKPLLVDDRDSLSRLSTLMESNNPEDLEELASPDITGTLVCLARKVRADKIRQITGSDEALAFHNAIQLQANMPSYLRPNYAEELRVDKDGTVRAGTLNALVEKLCTDSLAKDSINLAKETLFQNIFLMTFRTFTTADTLFDMLVGRFRMDPPHNLTDTEFEEWKKKKFHPMQKRILAVFTLWLEHNGLLEEEPHIAARLTNFLGLIIAPPALVTTAKMIVQTIERLTFASPVNQSPITPRKRRKSRAHKNDLLRLDPIDIAEQLCLIEHNLYVKVTPQECLNSVKARTAKSISNMNSFCSTHDKLASWVKMSILNVESLGKRADTVDFWIKVAEKCRNLNNFASMSAVINALSSAVISRLPITWAHVGKKSHLDSLLKYNEPTGGFSGYRTLLQSVEGPCVPFVGMYLTDLVHINDQYKDEEIVTATNPRETLICFGQRRRWYDVVTNMSRFQSRTYNIAENEPTRNFILGHLRTAFLKDEDWFWQKSQEVQETEFAHADIRKGLEAAGF